MNDWCSRIMLIYHLLSEWKNILWFHAMLVRQTLESINYLPKYIISFHWNGVEWILSVYNKLLDLNTVIKLQIQQLLRHIFCRDFNPRPHYHRYEVEILSMLFLSLSLSLYLSLTFTYLHNHCISLPPCLSLYLLSYHGYESFRKISYHFIVYVSNKYNICITK